MAWCGRVVILVVIAGSAVGTHYASLRCVVAGTALHARGICAGPGTSAAIIIVFAGVTCKALQGAVSTRAARACREVGDGAVYARRVRVLIVVILASCAVGAKTSTL